MTRLTTLDLSPFYRNSIGIDKLFDRMIHQIDTAAASTTNYPPYNIVKTGENTYEIQVAVAGFTQGEVTVNVNEGQLVITGEKVILICPKDMYMNIKASVPVVLYAHLL